MTADLFLAALKIDLEIQALEDGFGQNEIAFTIRVTSCDETGIYMSLLSEVDLNNAPLTFGIMLIFQDT
jgi:hypothetical protein